MDKKGALELSITAIVVLIIAITLLGLAIFFIKNLFKGGTEIFTGELAKIKEQLRTNLEESGELFVFSVGSELEIKKGEPQKFYMGVRNTEEHIKSLLRETNSLVAIPINKQTVVKGQTASFGLGIRNLAEEKHDFSISVRFSNSLMIIQAKTSITIAPPRIK